jgi:hypothetical protein
MMKPFISIIAHSKPPCDALFSPLDRQIYPKILEETQHGRPDVVHHMECKVSSGVEVGFSSGNRLLDSQQRLGSSMAHFMTQRRAILKGVKEKSLMIRAHGND